MAGVRAGDLAVAHQRRRQRERRLAPAGAAAGAVQQRVPEHAVRDAVGVDVVLEADARRGRAARRGAREPELLDRDGLLGAQAGDLRAVVRRDVPAHVRGERRRRVAVDRDVRADRVDGRLHHLVEVPVDHGQDPRRSSRSSTSSVTLISLLLPPAPDCVSHTDEHPELWRTATMSAPPRATNLRRCCEVDGLTVRFGGLTALDDVSLTVAPGEVVGVIGPNGAGKTTLFNVICGFVRADAGSVRFGDDRRCDGVRPHELARLGIARTLQGVGLFGGLTAVENVMVGRERQAPGRALVRRCSGSRAPTAPSGGCAPRALAALDDARRRRRRRPAARAACPTAIQKRVALARALVARPRLLLLDEPAGGLGEDDMAELGELHPRRSTAEHVRAAGRAPHGPGDGGLRPRRRARLRPPHRRRARPPRSSVDPRVLDAYLGVEVDAAH